MIGILLIAALVVSVLDHIYYVKYINSRLRRIDYRLLSKPKRYLNEDIVATVDTIETCPFGEYGTGHEEWTGIRNFKDGVFTETEQTGSAGQKYIHAEIAFTIDGQPDEELKLLHCVVRCRTDKGAFITGRVGGVFYAEPDDLGDGRWRMTLFTDTVERSVIG